MHYPIQDFKHMNRVSNPAILLSGHLHSFEVDIPKHSYTVGVAVNNYTPINIKEAIRLALENEGGRKNNV